MNLLPCPFCGGAAEIEQFGTRRQSTQYACTSCGCRLETGEEWDHGSYWNKRALAPASSDEITLTPELCKAGWEYALAFRQWQEFPPHDNPIRFDDAEARRLKERALDALRNLLRLSRSSNEKPKVKRSDVLETGVHSTGDNTGFWHDPVPDNVLGELAVILPLSAIEVIDEKESTDG